MLNNGESLFLPQAGAADGTLDRDEPAQQGALASSDSGHAQGRRRQGRERGCGAVAQDVFHYRPVGQDRDHQEEYGRTLQVETAPEAQSASRLGEIAFTWSVRR